MQVKGNRFVFGNMQPLARKDKKENAKRFVESEKSLKTYRMKIVLKNRS